MKVENLIKRLQKLDQKANIVFATDEELNELFDNVHIDIFSVNKIGYVISPNQQTNRTEEIYDSLTKE